MKINMQRYEPLAVAFLVAFALVVRLFYVWEIADTPLLNIVVGESEFYFLWAEQLARGEWKPVGLFQVEPLYSFALGLLFNAAGPGMLAVAALQSAVGAWSCLLVWWLARRLGGPRVALLALLFMAFNPVLIFFHGSLVKNSLVDLVNLGFCCLLLKAMDRDNSIRGFLLVLAGLVFGLAVELQANMIMALPVLLLWISFYIERSVRETRPRRANLSGELARFGRWLKPALKPFAWLTLGLALMVSPLFIYNFLNSGSPVLVTPRMGMNLFQANRINSMGSYRAPDWSENGPLVSDLERFRYEASRISGHDISLVESSRFWARRALVDIVKDPFRWFRLEAQKFVLFWHKHELPVNQSYYLGREYSPLLRWLPFSFGLLAPLGLLGLWLYRRSWRSLFPLYAMVGIYLAGNMVMVTAGEYRAPVIPFLSILAALGLLHFVRAVRWQRGRLVAACFITWIVASLFVNWPIEKPFIGFAWNNLARTAARQGYTEEADRIYKRGQGLENYDSGDKGKIKVIPQAERKGIE